MAKTTKLASRLAATEPHVRVLYVSTYIPRECGIATYTKDLTSAINILNPHCLADIVAIDDEKSGGEHRDYPWEVKYKIDQEKLSSWMKAADYINQSSAAVVNIQHEFGLYGGVMGEYIVPFMEAIKKPIAVTLHTVLPNPNSKMLKTVQRIAKRADAIIVMVQAAIDRLVKYYDLDTAKLVVIPHGVPDVAFGPTAQAKQRLGLASNNIISSFGLLSRSKGYTTAIKAMPAVLAKHPQTKLVILGETHPVVARHEGEAYRKELKRLVKKLKLDDQVAFFGHYLSLNELVEYLAATDVYITPYPNLDQISSGTLSYAVGAGKACVSSPYVYAQEVLSEGRGLLFSPNDEADLAEKINYLLDHPRKRQEMAKKAYAYGRNMIWPSVALRYLDLFEIVSKDTDEIARPAA